MLNPTDLQLLSDYLDDALTNEERAALEARLQTDAELSHELARLRATVELVGTLPTLSAPRSFALTPRMVRRPSILTSAAFSALSAAAAVILLVIGAALFSIHSPAPSVALDEVAFAPTSQMTALALGDTNIPAQNGSVVQPTSQMTATVARDLSSGGVSPAVGNVAPSTALKAATEPLADELFLAVPTSTAAPPVAPLLYAAAPSAAQSSVADTTVPNDASGAAAESQSDAAAQATEATQQAQQRLQTDQQTAPVQNSAAAAAPLPAPTQAPSEQPVELPSETPINSPSLTPTSVPSPMPPPTLAPVPLPVVNASQDVNTVGVGLIAAALVLFVAALVTTLRRRRG